MHFKIIIAAVTLTLGAPLVTDAAPPPGYQCVFEKPYSYCWKPAHANTKRGRWVWRTDYYLWVPARKFAAGIGPRAPGVARAAPDRRFPEDRAGLYQQPDGRWVREGYAHLRQKPAR